MGASLQGHKDRVFLRRHAHRHLFNRIDPFVVGDEDNRMPVHAARHRHQPLMIPTCDWLFPGKIEKVGIARADL
jgi:hypothetical protein